MVITCFADGFKIAQGHVAWIALGHGTIRTSDDDVSVAKFVHGLNAVQTGARSGQRPSPRSIDVDPAKEEINSKA